MLTADDEPALYTTVERVNPLTGKTVLAIPFSPDGACIYLGPSGCTIHFYRPKICRVFSCVGFVRRALETMPRRDVRRALKRGFLDVDVWNAGVERGGTERVAP